MIKQPACLIWVMNSKNPTSVSALLTRMAELLKTSHPTKARHYARTLLAFAEGRNADDFGIDRDHSVDTATVERAMDCTQQLCNGVPLSRIVGVREFWSMPFTLNEATLDPRPDSETVIETVLTLVTDRTQHYRILDLGTGSGCLLLALLSEYPNATGVGVDLSPRALEAARYNAAVNDLEVRGSFVASHWTEALQGTFDIIVSNPPYILLKDAPSLDVNVVDHDPALALFGGDDGLVCYRDIFKAAGPLLAPNGYIVVEIGHTQADDVRAIASRHGFHHVCVAKDIEERDRAVAFTLIVS